ncbi:MAG TPA: hypothetical protein VEL07_19070 [Planctomycetota bacterium]|nr:hypothetical protein [Planctomycetota bacterium]
MSKPRIAADRLYALDIRPQELAVYGERVRFDLRYAPIFDDPAEVADRHYKLLVLEILAPLPPADAQRRGGPAGGGELALLKIGWELELTTATPCRVGTLTDLAEELPLLLGRVADTVNELARRAKLEAPLGPDLVRQLIADFRAQARPSN